MTRDPKHVFIGLAIGNGSTRWETSMSLIRLSTSQQAGGYSFYIVPGGGCDVAHARNLLTHHCLTKTDCGRIFFIDSDEDFLDTDVLGIVKHDLPVISGLYPKKAKTLQWSYSGRRMMSKTQPGLWEVDDLCTGFMCVNVEQVILPMIARYPETEYVIEDEFFRGEIGHELFAMGVVNRRRLSEDYFFSMRARELGHTLYIDPKIQVGHVGPINFLDLHQNHPEVVKGKKLVSSHG